MDNKQSTLIMIRWSIKKIISYLIRKVKKDAKGKDFIFQVCLKDEIKEIAGSYPNSLFIENLHIERTIRILKDLQTDEKKLIIDIGAAKGEVTNTFNEIFPEYEIYSFEPISSNFTILSEKFNNNPAVHLFDYAIGSYEGTQMINITSNIGSSSLLKPSPPNDNFFSDKLKSISKEKIKITLLDKIIPSNKLIALIKIDVQGFENEVLKGGLHTLKNTDVVLIEMLNHTNYSGSVKYYDLDQILRSSGFNLLDIIPSIKVGAKLYEWDAIYLNKKVEKFLD